MSLIFTKLDRLIDKIDSDSTTKNKQIKSEPLRITELSNELSTSIDVCSPMQILRILRSCDAQMFSGWKEHLSIYDFIPILSAICRHAKDILTDTQNNKCIISGCGTSGRLAFLIARAFNEYLAQNDMFPCFEYLISGKDKALLISQELFEDDPKNGVDELKKCSENAKRILFIGITCGLSATFVGGQLEYALKQKNFIAVLMGFNPAHLAKDHGIEKWKNNMTFRKVAMKMNNLSPKPMDFEQKNLENVSNYILLNPIVGPEAITGSTRMKGGSCTMMLLKIIFFVGIYAMQRSKNNEKMSDKQMNEMIFDLMSEYEGIYRYIYSYQHMVSLGKICKLTVDSLQSSDGKVLYFGDRKAQTIMSFIDASEMRPTFGTELKRYRCYFDGGWMFMKNKEGDLSDYGDAFNIDCKCLNISSLTSNDLVIVIGNEKCDKFKNAKCKIVHISVENEHDLIDFDATEFAENVCLKLVFSTRIREQIRIKCHGLLGLFDDFYKMFATKLLLNAISTTGHVLSGSVMNNRMINVRVSNDKLFYRAIGLIQHFGNVTFEMAQICLLKSIYGDNAYEDKMDEPVSKHIISSKDTYKTVPVAILLALQMSNRANLQKSVDEIRAILKKEPSVRNALNSFCVKVEK